VLDAVDEAYDDLSDGYDISELWSVLRHIAASLISQA